MLHSRDSSSVLFSRDEFKNLFGRNFDPNTDAVFVMNGDGMGIPVHVDGCVYFRDSGTIYATFGAVWNGDIRINYLVAMA